jgi:hypothetical protein
MLNRDIVDVFVIYIAKIIFILLTSIKNNKYFYFLPIFYTVSPIIY